MKYDDKIDTDYYEDYIEAVNILTENPFSDLTMKRQIHVLSSSILLLALTTISITLKKGSILGIEYIIVNPNIAYIALIIACIFFTISFYLSSKDDFNKYRYKSIYAKELLLRLLNKTTSRFSKLLEDGSKIRSSINERNEDIKTLQDEIYHIIDAFKEKYLLIESSTNETSNNVITNISDIIELSDNFKKRLEPYYELIRSESKRNTDDYNTILNTYAHNYDEDIVKKHESLIEALTFYPRIKNFRVYVEIFTPLIIGCISIIASIIIKFY